MSTDASTRESAPLAATHISLGYLAFEVSSLEAWEAFATRVLGVDVAARLPSGGFTLRMDGHEHRFFLEQGPADDVTVIGWEVPDAETLRAVEGRLRAAKFDVTEGTPSEIAFRKVARLIKFVDPGGIPTEVFYGPALAATPFQSKVVRSGFVADALGLGHAVITANSQDESHAFYRDVMGFRLSDHIRCDIHGYKVDIAFMHGTARHHTVAFGDKQRKRIHHFMLETKSMDDVGLAFDRALRNGTKIMQTLGRHPNDRMFSFYAKTPSGFQFELGWGGREVDDATWVPTTYDHISEWGHQPPEFLVPRPAAPRAGADGSTSSPPNAKPDAKPEKRA